MIMPMAMVIMALPRMSPTLMKTKRTSNTSKTEDSLTKER